MSEFRKVFVFVLLLMNASFSVEGGRDYKDELPEDDFSVEDLLGITDSLTQEEVDWITWGSGLLGNAFTEVGLDLLNAGPGIPSLDEILANNNFNLPVNLLPLDVPSAGGVLGLSGVSGAWRILTNPCRKQRALHLDTQLINVVFCGEVDLRRVSELLQAGAGPNVCNNKGFNALAFAVMHRNYELAKLLLDAGADVNGRTIAPSHGQYTPLILALGRNVAIRPNLDMVELLLRFNADVELPAGRGKYYLKPLMYAIRNGSLSAVELLLRYGACVEPLDDLLRANFMSNTASLSVRIEIVQMLLGCTFDSLVDEAIKQNISTKNFVTLLGAIAYLYVDEDQLNALYSLITRERLELAIRMNNPRLLKVLFSFLRNLYKQGIVIQRGLDDINVQGKNLLFLALAQRNLNLLKVLLESGFLFDLDRRYECVGGKTLLHLASEAGLGDILNYLIKEGASHSIPDFKGRYPFQYWPRSKKSPEHPNPNEGDGEPPRKRRC